MQPVTPSTPTQDPIGPPTQDPAEPLTQPMQPIQAPVAATQPEAVPPLSPPQIDPYTPPPKQPSFADSPAPAPAPNNKKKLLIIVGAVILLLLIGGGVFALLSKSDSSSNNSNDLSDRYSTPDEDVIIEDAKPDPAKTEIPLTGKAVTNELGFTVTATKLVRNLPTENKDDDEEVMLLEVSISTDGTYTGGPGASDLRVLNDSGIEFRKTYTVPETELTELGYTPLSSSPSPKVGSPNVGYVAFAIPKETKSLTLRLKQSETKILGGGTIAAKDFDIKLTD